MFVILCRRLQRVVSGQENKTEKNDIVKKSLSHI